MIRNDCEVTTEQLPEGIISGLGLIIPEGGELIEEFNPEDGIPDEELVGDGFLRTAVISHIPSWKRLPSGPRDKKPKDGLLSMLNDIDGRQFIFFCTINISPKHLVMAKHFEHGLGKVFYKKYRWGDLTQKEQYEYFKYKIGKFTTYLQSTMIDDDKIMEPFYHFFFEATRRGEVHCHFRLFTNYFKSIKDLRVCICNIFEGNVLNKHFLDVKLYDDTLWADYHNKVSKTFQSLDFKPIIKLKI